MRGILSRLTVDGYIVRTEERGWYAISAKGLKENR
jgi:DNA-binding PadR family transcriptional regulator